MIQMTEISKLKNSARNNSVCSKDSKQLQESSK